MAGIIDGPQSPTPLPLPPMLLFGPGDVDPFMDAIDWSKHNSFSFIIAGCVVVTDNIHRLLLLLKFYHNIRLHQATTFCLRRTLRLRPLIMNGDDVFMCQNIGRPLSGNDNQIIVE